MTRDELIDSLTATADHGWYADDDRYIEWSTETSDGRVLEVGDAEGEAIQLHMSRAELAALHRALTATLLADAA